MKVHDQGLFAITPEYPQLGVGVISPSFLLPYVFWVLKSND